MLTRTTIRFAVALLFALSMLFYVQRILIPHQEKDAAAHNRPRGNHSDIYARWLPARELLLHGRDPYSAEVTREIQAGYYGRPLDPQRPGEPTDQAAFAYPVYVVFLLAPTVTLPFSIVQPAFSWLLLLMSAAAVSLWLTFIRWRLEIPMIAIMTVLTVGSFAVIQGVKLQQLTLLVAGLIALSAALLSRGHLFSAGVLMACAAIKPQLTIPIAGWLLLWAFSNWTRRRRYVLGFGVTIALFLSASEWLLPGWLVRFREAVAAYRTYAGGSGSLLDTLITPAWGRLLTVLIVLFVVVLCWRTRKTAETQSEFAWITSLVLTVTVLIVPMIAPYNQVLLLPAILLLVRESSELWNSSLVSRALVLVSGAVIVWPWLGAGALTVGSAFASPDKVQEWWAVPLYSSLFIPLPVLALQLIASARTQGKAPGGPQAESAGLTGERRES